MDHLCGITIAKNAVKYDYCIKECILSLLEVCNKVICVYVESDDTTYDVLKSIQDSRFDILSVPEEAWNFYQDKERLSYITNIGLEKAEKLGFRYCLYVQADEILDPKSKDTIQIAIEQGQEAYMCRRINLWKTPFHELNVAPNRLPCSNYVIRLTKSNYRAVGDAESIGANCVMNYAEEIKIWHYGFVRKREVMRSKIINMQCGVFNMQNYDSKLDQCEVFNPDLWFDPIADLKPISEPHPAIMEDWIKIRP